MTAHRKFFSKLILLLLLLLIVNSCKSKDNDSINPNRSQTLYPEHELVKDLDQLIHEISKSSPKAFTDFERLSDLVNSYKSSITDMSKSEFTKLLANVISAVDCGHSSVSISRIIPVNQKRYFPLEIRVIGSEIYVYGNNNDDSIPVGAQIHSINSLESHKIINTLYSHMPSDGENITSKQRHLNLEFSLLYNAIIESPEKFSIAYSLANKNEKIYKTIPSMNRAISGILLSPLSNAFAQDHAVLRIGSFNKGESKRIIENFFNELEESNTKNLIVDMRGNGGGDPYEGDFLLRYLLKEPFRYFSEDTLYYPELSTKDSPIKENAFKGNLYVLIDGGCFSTTGHVLSHIKDKTNAIIIGQESGGGFVCNGNPQSFRLKNTGIPVNISQGVFSTTVATLEKGRGIMPDIQIDYSIVDYMAKRDLEYEMALSLINGDL